MECPHTTWKRVCVCLVSFIFQRLTHPTPLFTDLGRRGEVWKICIFSYNCPFVEHQSSVIFLTEVRVSLCQRQAASLNPYIAEQNRSHKTSIHIQDLCERGIFKIIFCLLIKKKKLDSIYNPVINWFTGQIS